MHTPDKYHRKGPKKSGSLMTQISPRHPDTFGGNIELLSQVSESMGVESHTCNDNNEVDMELMKQMQQEGAEFNPNELCPPKEFFDELKQ